MRDDREKDERDGGDAPQSLQLTWRSVRLLVEAPLDLLHRASRLLAVGAEPPDGVDLPPPDVVVRRVADDYLLRSRVEVCSEGSRDDALMKLLALLSFH